MGYDPAHLASQPPLPSAPHDGRDMDSCDAAGWYKAYMPAEAAAPARPLRDRALSTVRAPINGQVYGYLSVEHPSATLPGHDQQHDLLQIARTIALRLERRCLYQQMTESAQEASRGTLQSGNAYALGQKDRSPLEPLRSFLAD